MFATDINMFVWGFDFSALGEEAGRGLASGGREEACSGG